jgi:hypothetical protein
VQLSCGHRRGETRAQRPFLLPADPSRPSSVCHGYQIALVSSTRLRPGTLGSDAALVIMRPVFCNRYGSYRVSRGILLVAKARR